MVVRSVDGKFVTIVEDNELRDAGGGGFDRFVRKSKRERIRSRKDGDDMFSWMMAPLTVDSFYRDFWERRCALIRRPKSRYIVLPDQTELTAFNVPCQTLLPLHPDRRQS